MANEVFTGSGSHRYLIIFFSWQSVYLSLAQHLCLLSQAD